MGFGRDEVVDLIIVPVAVHLAGSRRVLNAVTHVGSGTVSEGIRRPVSSGRE